MRSTVNLYLELQGNFPFPERSAGNTTAEPSEPSPVRLDPQRLPRDRRSSRAIDFAPKPWSCTAPGQSTCLFQGSVVRLNAQSGYRLGDLLFPLQEEIWFLCREDIDCGLPDVGRFARFRRALANEILQQNTKIIHAFDRRWCARLLRDSLPVSRAVSGRQLHDWTGRLLTTTYRGASLGWLCNELALRFWELAGEHAWIRAKGKRYPHLVTIRAFGQKFPAAPRLGFQITKGEPIAAALKRLREESHRLDHQLEEIQTRHDAAIRVRASGRRAVGRRITSLERAARVFYAIRLRQPRQSIRSLARTLQVQRSVIYDAIDEANRLATLSVTPLSE